MLESLTTIHFIFFISFLIIFGLLENFFPLRKNKENNNRKIYNLSLVIIDSILVRILLFITPLSIAIISGTKGIGIFNYLDINILLEIFISVIIMDFIIYKQHVYSHKWKWFWKIHSIHHSDKHLDVTTALRFHPIEIIISSIIKIFFVVILGISPISIVTFEIILVCSAIFNHSNLKINSKIDSVISKIIVTPDFHQNHHSVDKKQTDSNFGFFFSFWDKLCNTYSFHKIKIDKLGLKNTKDNLSLLDLILLKIFKS